MLMLTGVVVEITEKGPVHMALFTSPRVPGAHYKIQVDSATAARIRALINTETMTAEMSDQMADQFFGGPTDDEEEPKHDPFGRN
jgi:hypothetical protein